MTNQLSYSDWHLDSKKNSNNNRARTIKNNIKKIDKTKFKKLLNNDSDSDSESEMGDFNPPPKPEIVNNIDNMKSEYPNKVEYKNEVNYNNKPNKQYNNNVSYPFSQYNDSNEILSKKLNYMINLLEEQKDEKTKNITEELILYCFLGIFIIFLIDSFVKVGKSKYTR
tara:strand:+ start:23 stop:526 length:504 start_codon:yes stop_codon:yes gene_type:complete